MLIRIRIPTQSLAHSKEGKVVCWEERKREGGKESRAHFRERKNRSILEGGRERGGTSKDGRRNEGEKGDERGVKKNHLTQKSLQTHTQTEFETLIIHRPASKISMHGFQTSLTKSIHLDT